MKKINKTTVIFIFIGSFTDVGSVEDKIKIGMLVPMTGDNKEIGELIIKAAS